MASPGQRSVTPIIAFIRDWLSGRAIKNHLRWEQSYSPRTQPDPNLPVGPSHKLSANDYHLRDGRRESKPAVVLFDRVPKLASGQSADTTSVAPPTLKPGLPYNWETGKFDSA